MKKILGLVLLLCSAPLWGQITVDNMSYGCTTTCQYSSSNGALHAGDALVAVIVAVPTSAVGSQITWTVSDNNSNSYTQADATYTDSSVYSCCGQVTIYVACNGAITPNAYPTITATNSGSYSQSMRLYALNGAVSSGCVHAHNHNVTGSVTSGTNITSGSVTTTVPNTMIIGNFVADYTGGLVYTAVSPWTFGAGGTNNFDGNVFQIVSATGSYNPTITQNGTTGAAGVTVAIKAANQGGGKLLRVTQDAKLTPLPELAPSGVASGSK